MPAELAPADFTEEFIDIAGESVPFGGGEAGGVPDLAGADLAKAQMRRQARGAGAVGPVAIVGIARRVTFQKGAEAGLRGLFTGGPMLSQAAGPIRMPGFETPVFEAIA